MVGGQPGKDQRQTARPEQQSIEAYDERIIAYNPIRGIEGIKTEEGKRMYLTIEEVRMLAKTECHYPSVKRAFLFSCLTGLHRSDIERLKWRDVFQQGEFTRIIFNQKKTNGLEYLDLAPEAVELMASLWGNAESPMTMYSIGYIPRRAQMTLSGTGAWPPG